MCSSSHHYSTDDGVDGTHLILQIQYTSVRNYNTATGLTEDQCINNCIDGTWANCVGFSRFTIHSTMDNDDNVEMTQGQTPASCWWITSWDDGFQHEWDYQNGALAPILPCPATLPPADARARAENFFLVISKPR